MRTSSLAFAALLAAGSALSPAPPAAAQTTPLLTYTQPLTPQGMQLVQQRLRQQGAYAGEVDGIWGPDSQAALERFQQMHGLQVTGQLNQATVATLGIAPDQLLNAGQPVPVTTASPVAASSLSPSAIQSIQSRLRELNYYGGPTDGIWGGETQAAIERFQQGRGLQPNGQLNPATIAALGLDPNILVQAR
jgi:peptidoglycan hydrolase-like protein with peptidoglycan-binding domain